ncbi:MAG: hypothetical protein LBG05_07295 [Treponema sp.]|jgi:hypothetical protein|nr:hypothetical protein [Treponema sp.]
MMKTLEKLLISAALIAAVALAACGEGTKDDNNNNNIPTWYATGTENGTAATDNTVSLTTIGDNYVYIYFDPPGNSTYTNIVLDVVINPGQNVSQQCVYTAGGTWGRNNYLNWFDTGTISIPATSFNEKWSGEESALNIASIKGLCIVVYAEAAATIKVNDVRFE